MWKNITIAVLGVAVVALGYALVRQRQGAPPPAKNAADVLTSLLDNLGGIVGAFRTDSSKPPTTAEYLD